MLRYKTQQLNLARQLSKSKKQPILLDGVKTIVHNNGGGGIPRLDPTRPDSQISVIASHFSLCCYCNCCPNSCSTMFCCFLLLGLALSKLTSLVIAGKEGAHISISAMIFPNKPPKLVPWLVALDPSLLIYNLMCAFIISTLNTEIKMVTVWDLIFESWKKRVRI